MLKLNTGNIYLVLKDFYTLTRIRIALFDADLKELLSYPKERFDFCAAIRSHPELNRCCTKSDNVHCVRCAATGRPELYQCHAGLTEAVVPISDSEGVLGYVMFGQILPKENYIASKAELRRQFPEEKYPDIAEKIDRIPAKSSEELNAAATVLQALTAYLLTNHWVTPEKAAFIRQLDAYLAEHRNRTVTSEELCRRFHMGRSQFYALCRSTLGCGPAEYARHQRLTEAQTLLRETDLSVTEIALSLGFSDYNHFSRVFKAAFGRSAREYRRQSRG